MAAPTPAVRSPWAVRCLLGALGLAVRLTYVLAAAPRRLPIGDPLGYHLQANALAAGHGFVSPFVQAFSARSVPTAAEPPLFTLVLALGSLLGAHTVLAHQVLGALIGTGTVVVVALIGAQCGGRRCGYWAGLLAAVYPPLWISDGGLGAEGLFALVTAATVLAAYRFGRDPKVRSAAVLGAAVGLATLTRVEGALLGPLLVVPVVLRRGRASVLRRVTAGAGAALMTMAVIAPWTIRNLITFERPVLLSTGEGTLAGANCGPAYQGAKAGLWIITCVPAPPPGDESVVNAFWRQAGITYARDHARRLPAVMVIRVARTWQLYGPVQDAMVDRDDGRPRWANLIGLGAYGAVAATALGGAVVLARRRAPVAALVAPLVLASLTAATIWGAVRFRAPAEISLVVLAAVALDRVTGGPGRTQPPISGDRQVCSVTP
ncbi:MAG: hypothetical protein NVSMB12_22150 [Acidimicrobiales bacterium]